jgi:hypothetical protein
VGGDGLRWQQQQQQQQHHHQRQGGCGGGSTSSTTTTSSTGHPLPPRCGGRGWDQAVAGRAFPAEPACAQAQARQSRTAMWAAG